MVLGSSEGILKSWRVSPSSLNQHTTGVCFSENITPKAAEHKIQGIQGSPILLWTQGSPILSPFPQKKKNRWCTVPPLLYGSFPSPKSHTTFD